MIDPEGSRFYVEWGEVARETVANLRHSWGGRTVGDDRSLSCPSLSPAAPPYRPVAATEGRHKPHAAKVLGHPQVGQLVLGYETFEVSSKGA